MHILSYNLNQKVFLHMSHYRFFNKDAFVSCRLYLVARMSTLAVILWWAQMCAVIISLANYLTMFAVHLL